MGDVSDQELKEHLSFPHIPLAKMDYINSVLILENLEGIRKEEMDSSPLSVTLCVTNDV